jgi:hypothetical protein
MKSNTYKNKMQKISEVDNDFVEYSKKVTERFCELFKSGKILLNDQMKVISELSNIMQPLTPNQFINNNQKYTSFNGVMGAIKSGKLMYFEIGQTYFIPKQ